MQPRNTSQVTEGMTHSAAHVNERPVIRGALLDELVTRVRGGDRNAADVLLIGYERYIANAARRHGRRIDREDAMQPAQ